MYKNKKERKANGRNAKEMQAKIVQALLQGNEYRARVLYKRGKRRGYNVCLAIEKV